jgi:hypothetical protein
MNDSTWSILIVLLAVLLVAWVIWMIAFRAQRGILGRLFKSSGLEIHIKNQLFKFDSVKDFRTFLSGKTEIPSAKMQDMMSRTDQQLEAEVEQLQKIENTLTSKLAATIRDPQTIDDYLDDATMVRFSQDYDWRQIMFELSKKSTAFSEYKLEAVNYYQQYIQSRINVANTIVDKRRGHLGDEDGDKTVFQETVQAHAEHVKKEKENLFVSTSLIDLTDDKDLADVVKSKDDFKRLPRGQTVAVDTSGIEELPIKIGSRKFTIEIKEKMELVSHKGERYPLLAGENLVGRSTKCSIVLNPELVDISRQHLVIELVEGNKLQFTDISSSGTRLPGHVLKIKS